MPKRKPTESERIESKRRKIEVMRLYRKSDNVKAHDRERKRMARSKPETRARQNALQRERRALKRQPSLWLSTLTMTILNTRNVFKLLLFTLPPVLVLSRILLIRPLQLLLPAPIAS
ncbi:hypothetical protein CDAR_88031 [Caerostris darwini]|uniref:Uncharacterized protein n=1 Tax=Caerostris darwini TaxID=1538125 RepID=A0AAV4S564_9ARAC|nr:hypothetical protein CDAR_88031 [Caerostris darwini]